MNLINIIEMRQRKKKEEQKEKPNIRSITKSLFENVIVVVFWSVFNIEIYQNNIYFLF